MQNICMFTFHCVSIHFRCKTQYFNSNERLRDKIFRHFCVKNLPRSMKLFGGVGSTNQPKLGAGPLFWSPWSTSLESVYFEFSIVTTSLSCLKKRLDRIPPHLYYRPQRCIVSLLMYTMLQLQRCSG